MEKHVRSRRKIGLAAALVAILGIGAAAGAWFFLLRSSAPAAVSIESAAAYITGRGPDVPATGSSEAAANPLAGTWSLAPGSASFAGYRVQETLAGFGANTAVGRTTSLNATLIYDGAAITGVQVTADLTKLKSDQSLRDRQLTFQAIETNKFPTATFSLSAPIANEAVPAESQTVTKKLQGDLTLHGVTRPISLEVQGQLKNGQLVIVGSTNIAF